MNVRKVFAKFYVGILVVLGLYVFFGSLIGVGIRKVVGEKKESHEAVKAIQTEVEEEPTKDKVTRFTIGDTIINRDYKLTVEGASIIVSDNKYAQPNENCESEKPSGILSITTLSGSRTAIALGADVLRQSLTQDSRRP